MNTLTFNKLISSIEPYGWRKEDNFFIIEGPEEIVFTVITFFESLKEKLESYDVNIFFRNRSNPPIFHEEIKAMVLTESYVVTHNLSVDEEMFFYQCLSTYFSIMQSKEFALVFSEIFILPEKTDTQNFNVFFQNYEKLNPNFAARYIAAKPALHVARPHKLEKFICTTQVIPLVDKSTIMYFCICWNNGIGFFGSKPELKDINHELTLGSIFETKGDMRMDTIRVMNNYSDSKTPDLLYKDELKANFWNLTEVKTRFDASLFNEAEVISDIRTNYLDPMESRMTVEEKFRLSFFIVTDKEVIFNAKYKEENMMLLNIKILYKHIENFERIKSGRNIKFQDFTNRGEPQRVDIALKRLASYLPKKSSEPYAMSKDIIDYFCSFNTSDFKYTKFASKVLKLSREELNNYNEKLLKNYLDDYIKKLNVEKCTRHQKKIIRFPMVYKEGEDYIENIDKKKGESRVHFNNFNGGLKKFVSKCLNRFTQNTYLDSLNKKNRVKLKLSDFSPEEMLYLREHAWFRKFFDMNSFVVNTHLNEYKEDQKKGFAWNTETKDIDEFVNSRFNFQEGKFINNLDKNILEEYKNTFNCFGFISWNFFELISKTNLYNSLKYISKIFQEISASFQEKTDNDEVVVKYIDGTGIKVIMKAYGLNKPMHCIIVYPQSFYFLNFLGKICDGLDETEGAVFYSDPFSVTPDYCAELIDVNLRFAMNFFVFCNEVHLDPIGALKNIQSNNDLTYKEKKVLTRTNLSSLISLEGKPQTANVLLDFRYSLMEYIKGAGVMNGLKMFSKHPTIIRSRLLLYCLKNLATACSMMNETPPTLLVREKFGKTYTANDKFQNLISWVSLEPIDSLKEYISEMYMGYNQIKKNAEKHMANRQILTKILEEQLVFNSKKDKIIECIKEKNYYKIKCKEHEFNPAIIMVASDYYKTSREIDDNKIFDGWHKHISGKDSTMFNTQKSSSIRMPFNLKYEKDLKTYNTKLGLAAVEKLMAGQLDHNPLVTGCVAAVRVKNDGGVHIVIFDKLQFGLREIQIMDIDSRMSNHVIESLSRSICINDEREFLTKGDKKKERVYSHWKKIVKDFGVDCDPITITNSRDQKRWNQRLSPFCLMAMFSRLIENKDLLYSMGVIFQNMIDKKYRIPDTVIDDFIKHPEIQSLSTEALNELKRQFYGVSDKNDLISEKYGVYMNISAGTGQGIMHFCSSLYHSVLQTFTDKIQEDLLKTLSGEKVVITSMVSSDDNSDIVSIIPTGSISKQKKNNLINYLRITSFIKTILSPSFNIEENFFKTTNCCLTGNVEFNSEWFGNASLTSPLIKVVSVATRITELRTISSRFDDLYNKQKNLLELGGCHELVNLCKICQIIAHYETLGLNTNQQRFKNYFQNIMKIKHPFIGFYPPGDKMTSGLFGVEHSMYLLKGFESTRTVEKIFREKTDVFYDGDSQIRTNLNIYFGGGIKAMKYLKKYRRIFGNHESELQENPYIVLNTARSKTDMLAKLEFVLNPEGLANSMSNTNICATFGSSVYILDEPCIILRTKDKEILRMINKYTLSDTNLRKMNIMINREKNFEEKYKKMIKNQERHIKIRNRLTEQEFLSSEEVKSFYKIKISLSFIVEIITKISESVIPYSKKEYENLFYHKMLYKSIKIETKKFENSILVPLSETRSKRPYKSVFIDEEAYNLVPLTIILLIKWGSLKLDQFNFEQIKESWEFYKTKIKFLNDDPEISLKKSPYDSLLSMLRALATFKLKKTSIRLLGYMSSDKGFLNMIFSTLKNNTLEGFRYKNMTKIDSDDDLFFSTKLNQMNYSFKSMDLINRDIDYLKKRNFSRSDIITLFNQKTITERSLIDYFYYLGLINKKRCSQELFDFYAPRWFSLVDDFIAKKPFIRPITTSPTIRKYILKGDNFIIYFQTQDNVLFYLEISCQENLTLSIIDIFYKRIKKRLPEIKIDNKIKTYPWPLSETRLFYDDLNNLFKIVKRNFGPKLVVRNDLSFMSHLDDLKKRGEIFKFETKIDNETGQVRLVNSMTNFVLFSRPFTERFKIINDDLKPIDNNIFNKFFRLSSINIKVLNKILSFNNREENREPNNIDEIEDKFIYNYESIHILKTFKLFHKYNVKQVGKDFNYLLCNYNLKKDFIFFSLSSDSDDNFNDSSVYEVYLKLIKRNHISFKFEELFSLLKFMNFSKVGLDNFLFDLLYFIHNISDMSKILNIPRFLVFLRNQISIIDWSEETKKKIRSVISHYEIKKETNLTIPKKKTPPSQLKKEFSVSSKEIVTEIKNNKEKQSMFIEGKAIMDSSFFEIRQDDLYQLNVEKSTIDDLSDNYLELSTDEINIIFDSLENLKEEISNKYLSFRDYIRQRKCLKESYVTNMNVFFFLLSTRKISFKFLGFEDEYFLELFKNFEIEKRVKNIKITEYSSESSEEPGTMFIKRQIQESINSQHKNFKRESKNIKENYVKENLRKMEKTKSKQIAKDSSEKKFYEKTKKVKEIDQREKRKKKSNIKDRRKQYTKRQIFSENIIMTSDSDEDFITEDQIDKTFSEEHNATTLVNLERLELENHAAKLQELETRQMSIYESLKRDYIVKDIIRSKKFDLFFERYDTSGLDDEEILEKMESFEPDEEIIYTDMEINKYKLDPDTAEILMNEAGSLASEELGLESVEVSHSSYNFF